ncbi:MAG: SLC13 family permease [Bacteroidota bacterium]|nr:SLC13 family permease [Bacteroidota bacterium]
MFFNFNRIWSIIPGFLAYIVSILLSFSSPTNSQFYISIGIAILIINLWISEIIPIWLSSLFPIILMPIHDLLSIPNTLKNYFNPTIFLFLGGFLLAYSVEKWHLHKRIAFKLLSITGDKPKQIIWGLMLTSALLSMWISNTATAIMMLPIALSITKLLENENRKISMIIVLCIAYGANIGGVATLIGTPPNIVYKGFVESILHQEITFFQWLIFGIPTSAIMLYFTYLILTRIFVKIDNQPMKEIGEMLDNQYEQLGQLSSSEKRTLIVFLLAIFFWIFSQPINQILGNYKFDFKIKEHHVALFFSFLLFIIPFKKSTKIKLLSVNDFKYINWSILLLFGAGISIAKGLETTGVIAFLGDWISSQKYANWSILLLLLIFLAIFLTEFMSNVALAQIFIPVVFGIALAMPNMNPHVLAIPVTIACSFAFMLPIATPPNAVVFSSGHIKMTYMIKIGFLINIVAIILLWLIGTYILPLVF